MRTDGTSYAKFFPIKLELADWQRLIALELGIKETIRIASLVMYMAGFSFLRFGWNKDNYKLYSTYSSAQYEKVMLYCCISVVLEFVNVGLMYYCFFKPRGIHIWQRTKNMFTSPSFLTFLIPVVALLQDSVYIALAYYPKRTDLLNRTAVWR
jgi:hypothetical protein